MFGNYAQQPSPWHDFNRTLSRQTNCCIYLWRRLRVTSRMRVSFIGVWTCGGNMYLSWACINRSFPSKGVGLCSPLAACSVYGDLNRSVHTVNNFSSVSYYQTHVCHFIWEPYVRLAFVPNMLYSWNKVVLRIIELWTHLGVVQSLRDALRVSLT